MSPVTDTKIRIFTKDTAKQYIFINQEIKVKGVSVGPGAPDKLSNPTKQYVIVDTNDNGNTRYLWQNIVPGEGWFVSAAFLKKGGKPEEKIPIEEAWCQPILSPGYPTSMSNQVKIDVTALPPDTGTIILNVNWVNRFRAGLSFGGNVICICTRAWWQKISTDEQNQIMIHEMGHQCGMVPDGAGIKPDKVSTYYYGKGHVGPHCHMGLSASLTSYGGVTGAKCVMFGQISDVSNFCSNCTPALKKVDLSHGWKRF